MQSRYAAVADSGAACRPLGTCKAKLARVVEAANAMIYAASGPADMAALEAEFGVEAGKGQQLFDDLNGAKQALDDGRIVALRELDQG